MNKTMIMLHCSATKENVDVTVEQIDQMHRDRGFRMIGYHYYIRRDGTTHKGREESAQGAHCAGYNDKAIGICYEGGLDNNGKAKDTRTIAQKKAIAKLLTEIIARLGTIERICGHRDVSPDLDGDGVVESHEWLKMCPCFNADAEYMSILR